MNEEDYKKIVELANECHRRTISEKHSWLVFPKVEDKMEIRDRLKKFGDVNLFEPVGDVVKRLKEEFAGHKTDLICEEGFVKIKVDDYTLTIDNLAKKTIT